MAKEFIFSFGVHADRALPDLLTYKNKVTEILAANRRGRMVMVLECVDMTPSVADRIDAHIKKGFLPSDSFLTEYFESGIYAVPKSGQLEHYRKEKIQQGDKAGDGSVAIYRDLDVIDSFMCGELAMIDDLFQQFPGRIQFLPEANPPIFIKQQIESNKRSNNTIIRIVELVSTGYLREAVKKYRHYFTDEAKYSVDRENRLVSRIRDLLAGDQDGAIMGIAVRFGRVHTRLASVFKKEGYNVRVIFDRNDENEHRTHFFTASHRMIRKLSYTGQKPNELEWNQLLMEVLLDIHLMNENMTNGYNYPEMTGEIYRFVRTLLPDASSIEKLEGDIRAHGYNTVVALFQRLLAARNQYQG